MTTKDAFTEEEWARLERAPIIAAMAISLADPGGPIEAVKESMAAIKSIKRQRSPRTRSWSRKSRGALPRRCRTARTR